MNHLTRRCPIAVVLAAGILLAAGCGGDDSARLVYDP
jgi:hypothetical protein